jgi:predicted Zn-ribbon and HTH transcriptional regulator
MDAWVIGIGAAVALQGLQTIQIAIVGRRVDRVAQSLLPPPPIGRRPFPPTCRQCGLPHFASELDAAGLCAKCRV